MPNKASTQSKHHEPGYYYEDILYIFKRTLLTRGIHETGKPYTLYEFSNMTTQHSISHIHNVARGRCQSSSVRLAIEKFIDEMDVEAVV